MSPTVRMALLYNLGGSFFNVLLIVMMKLMVINSIITPEIASFFRHISALLILSPFIVLNLKKSPEHFTKDVPHFAVFVRALFFAVVTFMWPIIYTHIPMHIATTIGFLVPFLSNIMLVVFLNEKIPSYIWISMAVGMVGVLVILKPYVAEFDRYYALAIICMILGAISATLNKFIAREKVRTNIALYYITIYSSIITTGYIFLTKVPIPSGTILPMVALGGMSIVSQFFVIRSYQTSMGYLVNSMEFLRFLMFLAADIILFGVSITMATILGTAVIGLSIYYILKRYRAG